MFLLILRTFDQEENPLVGPFLKFLIAEKFAKDKDSQSSVTQGFGDSAEILFVIIAIGEFLENIIAVPHMYNHALQTLIHLVCQLVNDRLSLFSLVRQVAASYCRGPRVGSRSCNGPPCPTR